MALFCKSVELRRIAEIMGAVVAYELEEVLHTICTACAWKAIAQLKTPK